MKATELMNRIEIDPPVMLGKPVVRVAGITVESLLEKLAAGANPPIRALDDEILRHAREGERILVTNDEGFGELTFLPPCVPSRARRR